MSLQRAVFMNERVNVWLFMNERVNIWLMYAPESAGLVD